MSFVELSGKNVRNLKDYKFTPSRNINIFAGKNGAGKTNLLESIYLNALGRSFRTSATRNLIADSEPGCWVFGHYQSNNTLPNSKSGVSASTKIGVERRKGNQQKLSINGVHHTSLAQLAALVPIIAIQPSETQLIDGSSSIRRKHLDWILFHVEPKFLGLWRENQKILKQRNILLRRFSKRSLNDKDHMELQSWDKQYIETCEQVSTLRQQLSEKLNYTTINYLERLPAFSDGNSVQITETYYKGWSSDKTLQESLFDGLAIDTKRGYTASGTHRGDLVLKANGFAAKEFLSRGQKKLLAMIMRLAQAKVLQEQMNQKSVLLLDDLFAELDEENVKVFVSFVEEMDTQVFLTCLHTETWVKDLFNKDTQVFHVEQGQILEIV